MDGALAFMLSLPAGMTSPAPGSMKSVELPCGALVLAAAAMPVAEEFVAFSATMTVAGTRKRTSKSAASCACPFHFAPEFLSSKMVHLTAYRILVATNNVSNCRCLYDLLTV